MNKMIRRAAAGVFTAVVIGSTMTLTSAPAQAAPCGAWASGSMGHSMCFPFPGWHRIEVTCAPVVGFPYITVSGWKNDMVVYSSHPCNFPWERALYARVV
ncbi:hypothetical protein [Rhodococcus daqingensis]|uniref:Secreted protein n=1 Tax=Rhodococcus daqingensis TaxID=2479363 RepID=A0ABW2S0L9_9NOCA